MVIRGGGVWTTAVSALKDDLGGDFGRRHPALAIAFARAAIASNPDRHFDNEMLLDVIHDARVDLDLETGGDPAEALFDWIEDRTQLKEKGHAEDKEMERLTAKLNETLAALEEKRQALRGNGAGARDGRRAVGAGPRFAHGWPSDVRSGGGLRRRGGGSAATLARLGGRPEGGNWPVSDRCGMLCPRSPRRAVTTQSGQSRLVSDWPLSNPKRPGQG